MLIPIYFHTLTSFGLFIGSAIAALSRQSAALANQAQPPSKAQIIKAAIRNVRQLNDNNNHGEDAQTARLDLMLNIEQYLDDFEKGRFSDYRDAVLKNAKAFQVAYQALAFEFWMQPDGMEDVTAKTAPYAELFSPQSQSDTTRDELKFNLLVWKGSRGFRWLTALTYELFPEENEEQAEKVDKLLTIAACNMVSFKAGLGAWKGKVDEYGLEDIVSDLKRALSELDAPDGFDSSQCQEGG